MRALPLFLAVVAAAAAGTAPATAAPPSSIGIEMSGQFSGPNSVSGSFTSRIGTVEDSGTYTETFGIDGDTIDSVKVLSASRGIIVLTVHGFVETPSPTSVTFRGGRWQVLFGTGAYAGLKARGRPGVTGSADLAAGTVRVRHRGKARLRPGS